MAEVVKKSTLLPFLTSDSLAGFGHKVAIITVWHTAQVMLIVYSEKLWAPLDYICK